jgi:hypothetical protein
MPVVLKPAPDTNVADGERIVGDLGRKSRNNEVFRRHAPCFTVVNGLASALVGDRVGGRAGLGFRGLYSAALLELQL